MNFCVCIKESLASKRCELEVRHSLSSLKIFEREFDRETKFTQSISNFFVPRIKQKPRDLIPVIIRATRKDHTLFYLCIIFLIIVVCLFLSSYRFNFSKNTFYRLPNGAGFEFHWRQKSSHCKPDPLDIAF